MKIENQGVIFKRDSATPINQEARILDFVAIYIGPLLPRNNFLSKHACVLHIVYRGAYIYVNKYMP